MPAIILLHVRWYCRDPLSYRNLEAMMAERGVAVDHSTLSRWVLKFAPALDKRLRPPLSLTHDAWRVDETSIDMKGEWQDLYRSPTASDSDRINLRGGRSLLPHRLVILNQLERKEQQEMRIKQTLMLNQYQHKQILSPKPVILFPLKLNQSRLLLNQLRLLLNQLRLLLNQLRLLLILFPLKLNQLRLLPYQCSLFLQDVQSITRLEWM